MPPIMEAPTWQGEVVLDEPREIVVDEDALSLRFRAQMETVLAPIAILVVAAIVIARFRRVGLGKAVSRAA